MTTATPRIVKYRFTLSANQIVDDIYAATERDAVLALERVKRGCSAHVLRVDRDEAVLAVRHTSPQPRADVA